MFYFVSIDILQAFDSIEIKKQCNIKWYLFIKDFIYKLNVLYNITIDYKWFESLCIIEIYKLYIQKKMVTNNSCTNTTTTITNIQPVNKYDTSFWKVCTIEYNNQVYLYHKLTNLLFIESNNIYMWVGILTNNETIEFRNKINKKIKNEIEDWLEKCGFEI